LPAGAKAIFPRVSAELVGIVRPAPWLLQERMDLVKKDRCSALHRLTQSHLLHRQERPWPPRSFEPTPRDGQPLLRTGGYRLQIQYSPCSLVLSWAMSATSAQMLHDQLQSNHHDRCGNDLAFDLWTGCTQCAEASCWPWMSHSAGDTQRLWQARPRAHIPRPRFEADFSQSSGGSRPMWRPPPGRAQKHHCGP